MKRLAYLLVTLGVLNFLIFMTVSTMLGGSAPNGKMEGGKYFLGSHGDYTEVPQSTYEYSRLHANSLHVTHPLIIIGGFILFRQEQKEKAAIQRRDP